MSSSLETRTSETKDASGDNNNNNSIKSSMSKTPRANASSCSVHFSSKPAESQRRLSHFSKIQSVLSNPSMAGVCMKVVCII